jgi:hypothetical protein
MESSEKRVDTRLAYRPTKCIANSQFPALLMQMDTSIRKEGASIPAPIMVNRIQLQPKNVNAYLGYLKEGMKPAMQKAGVDWWLVYRDVFGVNTPRARPCGL